MTLIIIAIVAYIMTFTFAWIFSLDFKSTIILIVLITLILFIITYFSVPEFALKIRLVNKNELYTTLEDVNKILSKEEAKYYKLAILAKPDECKNHTVNSIIKIGKDLTAQLDYKNYLD